MDMTFEQAMERLEEILKKLQDNDISLDDSIILYSEGAKLIKLCSDKLKRAELTIKKIDEEYTRKDE